MSSNSTERTHRRRCRSRRCGWKTWGCRWRAAEPAFIGAEHCSARARRGAVRGAQGGGAGAQARGRRRGWRRCSVPRRYVTRACPQLAPPRSAKCRASAACGRRAAAVGGPRPRSPASEVLLVSAHADSGLLPADWRRAGHRRVVPHALSSLSRHLWLKSRMKYLPDGRRFYLDNPSSGHWHGFKRPLHIWT